MLSGLFVHVQGSSYHLLYTFLYALDVQFNVSSQRTVEQEPGDECIPPGVLVETCWFVPVSSTNGMFQFSHSFESFVPVRPEFLAAATYKKYTVYVASHLFKYTMY